MAYTKKLYKSDKFGLIEKPTYVRLNELISVISELVIFQCTHTHTGNDNDIEDGLKISRESIEVDTFNSGTGDGLVPKPVGPLDSDAHCVIIWTGDSCPTGWSEAKDSSGIKWSTENRFIVAGVVGSAINQPTVNITHTHTATHTHTWTTDTYTYSHYHNNTGATLVSEAVLGTATGYENCGMQSADMRHGHNILKFNTSTSSTSHSHTVSDGGLLSSSITYLPNNVEYIDVLFCKKD